nr:Protein of unknown function DUF72 [uncultured bacterium]
MKNRRLYNSGTSGLVLPVPNKTFYPDEYKERSRLAYYSSLFNTIEINSSFYKLPRKITVAKWADEVNDTFTFSYKLWKEVTHNKNLQFDPENIYQYMDAISGAGSKKGCLLVQFPGKVSIDHTEQINEILNHIGNADEASGWKTQVEFRNTSLYHEEVYAILREHNAGLVVHDMNKSATPIQAVESDTVYLRFHGPEDAFRGSYSDEFLKRYASLIKHWLQNEQRVYVYFNNTLGSAVQDLMSLNTFVELHQQK